MKFVVLSRWVWSLDGKQGGSEVGLWGCLETGWGKEGWMGYGPDILFYFEQDLVVCAINFENV